MLPYSKVAMPIHLDPNSLVTSPVCTTAGQHTVPGDSDMDSSALPQVVMGSTFTLLLHCCATPPSVLGVHASSDQPPPAPDPRARTDGNWAPPKPGRVGGRVPPSARPTWGLSRPCVLLEPLSPSHARGCTLGSRTLGSHVPSAPQGRQGDRGTSACWRQEWKPGSAMELCQHCCAHGLLDRKLGDWGVAWGHVCWRKSLLRVSERVCFVWAAGYR